MMDYQIEASTRRCAATGRDLKPGEKIYSVIQEEAGRFSRLDFSHDAWQGPPSEAFSFWLSRVPAAEEKRRPRIDDDLLLDCFRRLQGQTEPDRIQFAYVIALLLMRRKRLKFETTRQEDDREVLRFRCPRSNQSFDVVNPNLTDEEMTTVQEEVFKLLGWE